MKSIKTACTLAAVAALLCPALTPRHSAAQGPLPRPESPERWPGLTVEYAYATTDAGFRVRTILTYPEDAQGPLPTVVLVPWMGDDPVEIPADLPPGIHAALRALIDTPGFAFFRTERPGLGESEGPVPADTDLHTEIDAYRAGLRAAIAHPTVDPKRIFIFAQSNGGAIAPLVVGDAPVAGYIVEGAWSRTWFEHMLDFERKRLTLAGNPPGEVSRQMALFARFYHHYFNEQRTPGDVIAEHPEFARIWHGTPTHQWGRPASFYHQAQQANVAEAWSAVDVPTLVLYGELDWFMNAEDHRLIVDAVNTNAPGAARLVLRPHMDHSFRVRDSAQAVFEGSGSRALDTEAIEIIQDWLAEQIQR